MKPFKIFLVFVGFLFFVNSASAQQLNVTQNLSFGSFIPALTTSSINISPIGNRTIYGNAIPIGSFNYSPAIIQYTPKKIKPNTIVHIMYDPNISLTSNGQSLSLEIGPTDKNGNMFVTLPNQTTEIRIGGTLTINPINQNQSGNYSGTYAITIIQE